MVFHSGSHPSAIHGLFQHPDPEPPDRTSSLPARTFYPKISPSLPGRALCVPVRLFLRLSFRCQNSCRSFKNRSDRSKGSFHALRFLQQRKSGFSYHLFSDTALKTPGESRDHRLFSVHNTRFCLSDGIFLLRQFLFSP